jgi:hypothetical protein
MFTLKLAYTSNPDIRGGYWNGKPSCPSVTRVPVESFADASKTLRAWVETWDLGGGNMGRGCGDLLDTATGRKVAHVSFNGRVWNLDGTEASK